jgi:hypothetical protein
MTDEEIVKLKIHDIVEIKADDENELNALAKVCTIDHWRKRIGVVNSKYEYAEFPYRKIVKKARS